MNKNIFWVFLNSNFKKIGIALVLVLLLLVSNKTTSDNDRLVLAPSSSPQALAESTAVPVFTVSPSISPGRTQVKVINVVDGDTFKIETGETVRFIGIDTPETVHPSKPVECFGKEASQKTTELIEGKLIEMEKDISETDRYGRILRYVWVDNVLINELLVREGYAYSSSYPPDVKYQNLFIKAQELAHGEKRGLWSEMCTVAASIKPESNVVLPIPSGTTNSNNSTFTCDCKKSCAKMSSCTEAQYQLVTCGCKARDGDGDGVACDSDCQ